jgi:16S rRNA (uracil1498-N3)-methyltransferase
MHRFFIPATAREGNTVTLTGGQAHQIVRVLRLRAGEEVVLLPTDPNNTAEWLVRLDTIGTLQVRGTVIAERAGLPEPRCAVTLFPALLKGERFDWQLQKITELGVTAIRPILTQRTVRKVERSERAAMERWQRIVTEAAEQSGRARIPALHTPVALGEWRGAEYHVVLVAHEGVTIGTVADNLTHETPSVALLIGPEGGFAADEVERLAAAGAIPVSLGPRILRAETAAITALTLTLAATGDLEPQPSRDWTPFGDTS